MTSQSVITKALIILVRVNNTYVYKYTYDLCYAE